MSQYLFQDLNFLVVITENTENASNEGKKYCDLLKDNGCDNIDLHIDFSDKILHEADLIGKFRLYDRELHFIVSNSHNFQFYETFAFDLMIPVVRYNWIDECLIREKLISPFPYSPNPIHILRDEQVYISKYTFNEQQYTFYAQLILYLGGSISNILSTNTTRVIANKSDDPAIVAVKTFSKKEKSTENIKFVYPTWILENFKTRNAKIDDLYHEITDGTTTTNQLEDMWKRVFELPMCWANGRLFNGLTFQIDLELENNELRYLESILFLNGGATAVKRSPDIIDDNLYLGHSPNNPNYSPFISKSIPTITLYWVFSCISLNLLPNYNSKLIYKVPSVNQINLFPELNLSYSNFYGLQKYYIQTLTKLIGGRTTPYLTKENNVLISKFKTSEKYKIASTRWKDNCHIINYRWLEETFKSEEIQSFDEKKYQNLPVNRNMFLDNLEANDINGLIGNSTATDLSVQVSTKFEESILEDDSSRPKDNAMSNITSSRADDLPEPTENITIVASKESNKNSVTSDVLTDIESVSAMNRTPNNDLMPGKLGGEVSLFVDSNISQRTKENIDTLKSMLDNQISHNSEETSLQEDNHQLIDNMPEETINIEEINNSHSVKKSIDETEEKEKGSGKNTVPNPLKRSSAVDKTTSIRTSKRTRTNSPYSQSSSSNLITSDPNSLEAAKILKYSFQKNEDNNINAIYDIRAVATNCLENIDKLDLKILQLIGIEIYEEIQEKFKLNCIFAKKRLRTAKFLMSYSFEPLMYTLLPSFIEEILKKIHDNFKYGYMAENILLPINKYHIPEIELKILELTNNRKKVFERYYINKINLIRDMPGGATKIASILKSNGIRNVKVLSSKFNKNDIIRNDIAPSSKTATATSPEAMAAYIFVVTKESQAKRFKTMLINSKEQEKPPLKILIVEWSWCVECIFNQTVSYAPTDKTIVYQQGLTDT